MIFFQSGKTEIVLAVINAKWIHPSLALRLLKANLGPLESRCAILEFALRQRTSEKIDAILTARPRIMGLSVSIWNHLATLDLLKALHEKWRDPVSQVSRPRIILGGPEVSYLPRDAEIFRYADYVVRGEGEFAFRDLCESLLTLPVSAGTKDLLLEKPAPSFIDAPAPDISLLTSPYDLYTDEDLNQKLIYVESSRGCAFQCDFCLSAAQEQGKRVREFSLELFLADMERLLDRADPKDATNPEPGRTRTVKFLDRSFNINPRRAIQILNFFLGRIKNKNLDLCVHFEMVPFNFPPELTDTLALFPPGSLRLELGIQTFNPAAAALISRAGNTEEALDVLGILRTKTGAIIHVDLIAGLPGEDLESFGRGFDKLWVTMTSYTGPDKLPPMEIQMGILKLLPGSPMPRHTMTHNMVYAPEPPYEVMETAVIPRAEMDRIKNFARFWEVLVNRGHFPAQIARLVPPGVPVFRRFLELSDRLLAHFGKNWGIDRDKMREALTAGFEKNFV